MSRRLTFLFAVAAGAAIGNLYWAQPLLSFIADDLRLATTTAGWLITATQIGYAVGILLLVPLGDVLDRRRLVPVMLLASAVALLLCALAPSFGVLLLALALLGVTTISGQILSPLAGDLAGEGRRGSHRRQPSRPRRRASPHRRACPPRRRSFHRISVSVTTIVPTRAVPVCDLDRFAPRSWHFLRK